VHVFAEVEMKMLNKRESVDGGLVFDPPVSNRPRHQHATLSDGNYCP
jgi:hypothetical protein